MDAVHNPDNHTWIGEKINLNEYFTKFKELVNFTRSASAKRGGDLQALSERNVKKLVETAQNSNGDKIVTVGNAYDKEKDQLDDEIYAKIETLCDVDNLKIGNDAPPMQQFLDPGPTNRELAERQSLSQQYPKFQVLLV